MKSVQQISYTLATLTRDLDVTLKGDPNCVITGVSPIQHAQSGEMTFLTNSLYRKYLETTQASVVILAEADAALCPTNAVISKNPYYTYAKMAAYFDQTPVVHQGVHPTAIIGEGCQIHPSVVIGANCVIGRFVTLEANVVIGAGCSISEGASIGEASVLDANVTIYHRVKIGKRARIASGAVIGSEGFGFANQKGVWHKVPQLGSVLIGDDVDVGANTTIDRGAVEDTIIGNGVKMDNLIQIGHNVQIGDNTIIAGCAAIAGSTIIGKNCMIGGASCFTGHITLGDNIMITGMTGVSKSIREPGVYSSGVVGVVPNAEFRKNNARFHRLENLMQRVKTLETELKALTERKQS